MVVERQDGSTRGKRDRLGFRQPCLLLRIGHLDSNDLAARARVFFFFFNTKEHMLLIFIVIHYPQ